MPLPRTANGNGVNGNGKHGGNGSIAVGGHAGPDPAFCQWLYASTPRVQFMRPQIRVGESSLASLGELALPSMEWTVRRRRLSMGAALDFGEWVRVRGFASAYEQGEAEWLPAGEMTSGMRGAQIPALVCMPDWDAVEEEPEAPVELEPGALGKLMGLASRVVMRDWTAPMRSALPKPWGVEAWPPALPGGSGTRVAHGLSVDLTSMQTAPLIRNSRLLGNGVPSSRGYKPIAAEHRSWEGARQIPKAPQQMRGELARETSLSSLSVLAAVGPVQIKELLAGNQPVSSNPVLPQVPTGFDGLRLKRAARVEIATPYISVGQEPVRAQAKGIFPLPFLVPPLSPRIYDARFKAPMQGIRQLTLAPRRGVESYRPSEAANGGTETQNVAAQVPASRLKPVLDWLPSFGRPVAPGWELQAQGTAAGSANRASGVTELLVAPAPMLAGAIHTIEEPGMRSGPVKLLRLTMERVEMKNIKSRPMYNTDVYTPEREVLKPRARLTPKTISFTPRRAAEETLPVWRQKLDGMGQVWNRLPSVPKWGGLTVAALALAVGLGTRGSYTTEARAPRVAHVDMMPGQHEEGGLASIQKTILSRAAIALTDDFRTGLADWEGQGDWARSWSYDSAGFVRTGSLAIYTPSLSLTDYRLEFLGQIEKKSLSWVVRAKDFQNFYAIKITLRDDGPIPTAYLQRYAVIDGKPSDIVQKRLPMQVTQDMLYRVLMEARGSNYVLTVQGQIVDSWSEQRLKSGGVGFFSAKGELARLRWVGVWHQYDALGRLCAFLAPYSISDRERSGGQ